jgi:hypothetical protein
MLWAAHRKTTRIEDESYCLLGIFHVSMPLIYSEVTKAFCRLQEEIVKRSNDMTIFAWDNPQHHEQAVLGMFATSPAAFSGSSLAHSFSNHSPEFSVTNKGLLVSSHLPLRTRTPNGSLEPPCYFFFFFFFFLGSSTKEGQWLGIFLRKAEPSLFYRDETLRLAWLGERR